MDPQKSENEEKDFKSETNINISKYIKIKLLSILHQQHQILQFIKIIHPKK